MGLARYRLVCPSFLGFVVGGGSFSSFLASTVLAGGVAAEGDCRFVRSSAS